jgi:hypothetical protein
MGRENALPSEIENRTALVLSAMIALPLLCHSDITKILFRQGSVQEF